MMRRLLTIPATLAAAITAITAIAAPAPVAARPPQDAGPTIEFRVTRFDPADRPSPKFQAGPPGRQVEVEVPLTYIAGPFKAPLRNDRFLDLWRGGADQPEITLEITSAERSDLLLLFFPKDDSFHILKVQAPPTRIRGGDRFIINATNFPLRFKLGDSDPLVIAPAKSGVLRGPGGTEARTLPVLISRMDDGKWTLASTEFWHCDPRFRKFLVAYVSPRHRHLAFHGVSERL